MADTRPIKPEDNKGGTFTQQLSSAETTTAYVSPVPTQAPGVITAEPGTVNEEAIYFKSKDSGAGTISGLTRDYTNLNGGTGIQHENGEDWEVFQSAFYVTNIIDILMEGFIREQQTIARVDADEFTVLGNYAAVYNVGRMVRFNEDNNEISTVLASSYSGGTGLTTIQVADTIPDPLTAVEYGIQPKSAAYIPTSSLLDEDDFASNSASKVPSQQSAKAYVDSPFQTITDGATITANLGLGAYRKHKVTLGGNRTLDISNLRLGQVFMIAFTQDGTGSRTVTWPIAQEDFATTDVDTTDDEITVGLDIPTGTKVRVSSSTTLPAGLSAGTDYYVIRVDATTIKLATSLANAQAGTDIDITDQGTGTHTVHIYVRWVEGTEPTLSTGKYNTDYIGFIVEGLNASDDDAFVLSGHVISQGVV